MSAAVLVTGCSITNPIVNLHWQPPTWPAATIETLETLPEPIDASELTLLENRFRNADAGVQGRMAYLPGADAAAFNSAVDDAVLAGIAQATALSGIEYSPQSQEPGSFGDRGCVHGSTTQPALDLLLDPAQGVGGYGVAIACDVVIASGTVFGERIRTVVGQGDGVIVADAAAVIYTDTATGESAAADALWTGEAVDALYAEVVNSIRRSNGALSSAAPSFDSDEQRARFAAALSSTVPVGEGALAFTIPMGFTSWEIEGLGVPPTTEAHNVRVPQALVQTLATPLGQTIANAAGQPFDGPSLGFAGYDHVDCMIVACAAITYDDGPHGTLTPELLDTALEMRVPLTFYLLGIQVEQFPDVVRRAYDEGHTMANHSYNHPALPSLSDADVEYQLSHTSDLIEQITGERPTTFRPPYGDIDERVLSLVSIPAMNWSNDTNDWQHPGYDTLVSRGINDTVPGGIVLFHDIHPESVAVAASVFQGLRDRGFTLVTIPQLFDGNLPTEGVWATNTRRWGE